MGASVHASPSAKQQFNQNGAPVAGGKLFTYQAGTTTKLTTYTDAGGSTSNTNPIILDANGQCDLWLQAGQRYKFVLAPSTDTDPPTSPYWTVDDVTGVNDLGLQGSGYGIDQVYGGVKKVAGISALRGLRIPQGSDAQTVILDGGATANDGAGGPFIWNAADTRTDDGAYIINPSGNTGSGRWNKLDNTTAYPAAGARTQLFGDTTSGIAKGREYWDGSHAFYRTNNMYYANSQWNRDDTTSAGSKLGLGSQNTTDTWGSWNLWSINSTVPWNNATGQDWATTGTPLMTWGGTVGENLQINLPSSANNKIGAMTITGWANTTGGATSHTFFSLGSDYNVTWDVPAGKQNLFRQDGTNKAWLPFTDGNNYFGAHVYPTPGDTWDLGSSANKWANIWCDNFYLAYGSMLTANLPAAGTAQNGRLVYENAGGTTRNLVFYIDGARFRIASTSF